MKSFKIPLYAVPLCAVFIRNVWLHFARFGIQLWLLITHMDFFFHFFFCSIEWRPVRGHKHHQPQSAYQIIPNDDHAAKSKQAIKKLPKTVLRGGFCQVQQTKKSLKLDSFTTIPFLLTLKRTWTKCTHVVVNLYFRYIPSLAHPFRVGPL